VGKSPNMESETGTSDGISREDWAHVHQCAVDIANAALADDDGASQVRTRDLLRVLERLEHRYGALPSILATRADYIEDVPSRLTLYEAACDAASEHGDARNLVWIASSLAELYVDELREPLRGGQWLERLESHLANHDDPDERDVLERLRADVQKLAHRPVMRGDP
jgi:hypothetical protein